LTILPDLFINLLFIRRHKEFVFAALKETRRFLMISLSVNHRENLTARKSAKDMFDAIRETVLDRGIIG
jgi:hypothetical protein